MSRNGFGAPPAAPTHRKQVMTSWVQEGEIFKDGRSPCNCSWVSVPHLEFKIKIGLAVVSYVRCRKGGVYRQSHIMLAQGPR